MWKMFSSIGVGSGVGVTTGRNSIATVSISSVCIVSVERRWSAVPCSGGSGSGIGSARGSVVVSVVRSGWDVGSVVVAGQDSGCGGSIVVANEEVGAMLGKVYNPYRKFSCCL